MHKPIVWRNTIHEWLALGSLLALFFFWQVNHLEGFAWSYDEGVYLTSARAVCSGQRLYSEVFSSQPPAFISSIAWAFRLGGTSVATGRALIVLYATIGLLAVALMARELGGSLAGLAAVALLAIAPDFFPWSKTVMADLPSVSLAALAMALTFPYLRSGERSWLIFTGLALSASLLIKMFALSAFIPITLVVFWRLLRACPEPRRRDDLPRLRMEHVKEIGLLAVSIALPVLFCLLIYNPQDLYDQVVAFHLQAKKAFPLDIASNWRAIWQYLEGNRGFLPLAIYGALLLVMKRSVGAMAVIGWLILAAGTMLIYSPLWPGHHLIVLLPPLAILAGVAMGDLWGRLRDPPGQISPRRFFPFLVGLCTVVFYLSDLPAMLKKDAELSVGPQMGMGEEAVQFINAMTNPNDFIITDEQMIAFRARRQVPPLLCDTSFTRIRSGYLTAAELIEASKKFDAQVVLVWSGRFATLPEYGRWVRANYRLVKLYDAQHQIYQKRSPDEPLSSQQPLFGGEVPSSVRYSAGREKLGDYVTFLGYDLDSATVEAGGKLHLTLYWRTERVMDISYTVFTHLIDAQEHIWGQWDSIPCGGACPTTWWIEGDAIADEYEVAVDPDAPAGEYQIEVGVYNLETMERLPVFDKEGKQVPEARILLDNKVVVEKRKGEHLTTESYWLRSRWANE